MIKAGIIGGAGYTAGELIRLLLNHPETEIVFINSNAQVASFLAEELAIGDMEDAVAALRAELAQADRLDPQEYELLFESAVAMQKELAKRRLAHTSGGQS